MCGIISSAVPVNPIGLDVRAVPGVKTVHSASPTKTSEDLLTNRLKDVRLQISPCMFLSSSISNIEMF